MTVTIYCLIGILSGFIVYMNITDKFEDDSPLEEYVEEIIEGATGIDIDLSPDDDDE